MKSYIYYCERMKINPCCNYCWGYRQNLEMKKHRIATFELLRILCILMVILLHFISHGKVLENVKFGSPNYYIAWLIFSSSYCAVDCFILLSGYFGIESRFKFQKLLLLWITVFFYSVFSYLICCVAGYETFSWGKMVKALFPVVSNEYWFFTCYIILYILSFALNDLLLQASKAILQKMVIIGIILFSILPTFVGDYLNLKSGHGIVWFVFLYIVGAYMKLHNVVFSHGPLRVFVASLMMLWMFKVGMEFVTRKAFGEERYSDILMQYNSIVVFIASLSLFCVFKSMKNIDIVWESNTICKIASLTFGVYLFHDNQYISQVLWGKVDSTRFIDTPLIWLYGVIVVLGIFVTGCAVEWVRKMLFDLLKIRKLLGKICTIVSKLLYALKAKGEILWQQYHV